MYDKHRFIVGTTQSGKTTLAVEEGKKYHGGVFLFNPQELETGGSSYTNANMNDGVGDIILALRSGEKINYVPHYNDTIAKKELFYLAEKIFFAAAKSKVKNDMIFIADECHIYIPNNCKYNAVLNIATRGLKHHVYLWSITQRPALTNNTLFTQSEVKTYLSIEEEEWQYFKKNGVPIEKIQKAISDKGKYAYVDKYVTFNSAIGKGYKLPQITKLH